MFYKKVVFPHVPSFHKERLTEGREYEVAGLDEFGIACILDDEGNVWQLDDGYGVRPVEFEVVA